MNNKIGVVVPSYATSEFKSTLTKFFDSLQHLACMDNLEFLFNFQNYAEEDRSWVLDKVDKLSLINNTWTYKYVFNDKYDPVSMVRIRNDCMMLDNDCWMYLSVDDDHVFHKGAGEHYNEILQFFKDDPTLGMVMSAGFLGGYNYKHKLKYAVNKHWHTCRGQLFRNFKSFTNNGSPIYSDDALTYCRAGFEDMVIAMETLSNGFQLATMFNNPTYTKPTTMESADQTKTNGKTNRYGDGQDHIHDVSTTFSAMEEYVAHRFDHKFSITNIKDYQPILTYIASQVK